MALFPSSPPAPAIPNCCTDNAICQDANPCNADYCLDNQCRHSAYNIVPGCCYAPTDANPFTGVPWVDEAERQLVAQQERAAETRRTLQKTRRFAMIAAGLMLVALVSALLLLSLLILQPEGLLPRRMRWLR